MRSHNERAFGFIVDSMIKKGMNPKKDLMSIINRRYIFADQISKYSHEQHICI